MKNNQYLKDFRSQVRTRFAEDSDAMTMSDWIIKNTKLRKKPYSFANGFEFQRQIVDDMHPNLCCIKCSQIGLTEVQLRKFAAFLARTVAVSAIFTLPDDIMMKRTSQTRFGPLISAEKVFNLGYDKPIRSMGLYQINQSFGYFTGNKEGDATSINADALFHDEVDLSDQEMLALFQSRLQGSDYRITQGFSTPTYEGFGIDASFSASDQHEYMIRCNHCRHHNIPEFNPNFVRIPGLSGDLNDLSEIDSNMVERLDLSGSLLHCEQCHNPLDVHDSSLRSWVPRFPGRKSRGYRVSPFSTPRLTVEYIVEQLLLYKQKDALRRWYNTVLGKSFNDSNARLTEEDIRAVMKGSGPINHSAPVVIGIDMGLICHIVLIHLGQKEPVIFDFRQVSADNLLDEVKSIRETYNLVGGCMDRHPYTPLANAIMEETDGLVIPVEYAGSPTSAAVQLVKDELDNMSHVRANRTIMIDTVATLIRKRRVQMVGYGKFEHLLVTHLQDMVRIEKEDTSAIWQKLTGNDHFFHAIAYGIFATRVNEALLYRSDADPRSMFATSNLIVTMKEGLGMGVQTRRKEAISLGTIS